VYNINLVMAARWRVLTGKNEILSGALLDKPDSDISASAIDAAYGHRGANQPWSVIDILELMVTELMDEGNQLPIASEEGYAAAQWEASAADPAAEDKYSNLPDPIPRSFALYLAVAWKNIGHFPTYEEALTTLLSTKSFISG
jgi:hypothetical protein